MNRNVPYSKILLLQLYMILYKYVSYTFILEEFHKSFIIYMIFYYLKIYNATRTSCVFLHNEIELFY